MKHIESIDAAITVAYKRFDEELARTGILINKGTFALGIVLALAGIFAQIFGQVIGKLSFSNQKHILFVSSIFFIFLIFVCASFMIFFVLKPKKYLTGMGNELLKVKAHSLEPYEFKSLVLESYINAYAQNQKINNQKASLIYYAFILIMLASFLGIALSIFTEFIVLNNK
ncbi:hypothetical protein SAMN05421780_11918 [Flexibacter flexilis DSM 6793]|uniref:Uncharacterized protein n=1 Tax=Flexibacter flexilis DSM 6793 TaxID=927664 RepID=A0A1I1NT80_9BACT|nr:hypothetical protein [Flexibacter flexilis]SFD00864.1 hypothetical protein SAMN05421780_11918 [Flexibacter flexilis DSM 6793]